MPSISTLQNFKTVLPNQGNDSCYSFICNCDQNVKKKKAKCIFNLLYFTIISF